MSSTNGRNSSILPIAKKQTPAVAEAVHGAFVVTPLLLVSGFALQGRSLELWGVLSIGECLSLVFGKRPQAFMVTLCTKPRPLGIHEAVPRPTSTHLAKSQFTGFNAFGVEMFARQALQ